MKIGDKIVVPLITEDEAGLPFYIIHAAIYRSQVSVTYQKGYQDYQWLHCTKGCGVLQMEGTRYKLSPGTGLILHPGVPYEYNPVSTPWETRIFSFGGYGIPRLLEHLALAKSGVYEISNLPLVEALFFDILTAVQSDSYVRGRKCSQALYRFFMEFSSFTTSENQKTINARFNLLKPVISYIEENFCSGISIDDLTYIIKVSRPQLHRCFKLAYNTSPLEYIVQRRIARAKQMMTESRDITVMEVAHHVGYKKVGFFCEVFKRHEGITPGEFKRMHHNI